MSLFTIEKKKLGGDNKHLKEEILNSIHKEAKILTKLRHPSILHILEPLAEDTANAFYGVEPVEGSLKYIMHS